MTWVRPLPTITPESAPFFDGLRERRFLVPRCTGCGDLNWSPYPACRSCLTREQEWTEVSGEGELHTFTVMHTGPRAFTADGPYVWGFARLRESPRSLLVMGNLVGVDHDAVAIGMPVRIGYFDVPDHDLTLYHFEAAEHAG